MTLDKWPIFFSLRAFILWTMGSLTASQGGNGGLLFYWNSSCQHSIWIASNVFINHLFICNCFPPAFHFDWISFSPKEGCHTQLLFDWFSSDPHSLSFPPAEIETEQFQNASQVFYFALYLMSASFLLLHTQETHNILIKRLHLLSDWFFLLSSPNLC